MDANVVDLWSADIGKSTIVAPVTILRQQAALLGKHTNNLLEGKVETSNYRGGFLHEFVIEAPALDGYTYVLFTVKHGLGLYPLTVEGEMISEGSITLKSEEEFLMLLRSVLNHPQTRRILDALLAQIQT